MWRNIFFTCLFLKSHNIWSLLFYWNLSRYNENVNLYYVFTSFSLYSWKINIEYKLSENEGNKKYEIMNIVSETFDDTNYYRGKDGFN